MSFFSISDQSFGGGNSNNNTVLMAAASSSSSNSNNDHSFVAGDNSDQMQLLQKSSFFSASSSPNNSSSRSAATYSSHNNSLHISGSSILLNSGNGGNEEGGGGDDNEKNTVSASSLCPITMPSASSSPKSAAAAAAAAATAAAASSSGGPSHFNYSQQRYRPYYNRSFSNGGENIFHQSAASSAGNNTNIMRPPPGFNVTADSGNASLEQDGSGAGFLTTANNPIELAAQPPPDTTVTLQISNIDASIDDRAMKQYIVSKLKPITPIVSFSYEGLTVAKLRIPSHHHAKQVVAYLHRKKIGHKRIIVSYTRDSSSMEPSMLRCQVAGLLKDIPFYKLSMYKFRELFQSRFKTSISVMDLYDMKDICNITENGNEEKFISLRPELASSIESSELLGCLQLSVPYCTAHFKSGHRGWAELDIEPLPNVYMSLGDCRAIIYALLKSHKADIPIASIVYCIEAELNVSIERNESGVNLEHLISCLNGVHITTNKFGIKILSWLATADTAAISNKEQPSPPNDLDSLWSSSSSSSLSSVASSSTMTSGGGNSRYAKGPSINLADPFGQISREVIELIRLSPKSMMKFSRFIPAYHNHFGKQCRVADYGYTKLIELFEALTGVVQIMGEGELRQITLTHKCQIRCFTSDLMRILRAQSCKWIKLSHLPALLSSAAASSSTSANSSSSSTTSRKFDITDYGVCDLDDMLEPLVRNNLVTVEPTEHGDDVIVQIPKRRQSQNELTKTSTFAGEVVEVLRNASQYMVPFEKFACSYHYHYGYQCRLSDYGYLKLMDLMEAITGVCEVSFFFIGFYFVKIIFYCLF